MNGGASIFVTPFTSDLGPFCYLLEINQTKILLDCGVGFNGECLDVDHLKPLGKLARELETVVCSHASLENIGGLLYLYGKMGASCPIYMTVAQCTMARILFMDLVETYFEDNRVDIGISMANIKIVLQKIVGLRYSQPVHLDSGIVLTGHPAGHSLGGSYWKLRKDNEDLVYAVKFNHKKEGHLDGSTLPQLTLPSVLITDATNALSIHQNRKARDKDLIDTIIGTLTNGGNVLIPVASTGRVLELLLLLDSAWSQQEWRYPIYYVGEYGPQLVDFAKSMLEWMGENVSRLFASNRENPFEFKHIWTVHSIEEVLKRDGPRVVLANGSCLEGGYSRRLFHEWAPNAQDLVMFLSTRFPRQSLAQIVSETDGDRHYFTTRIKVPLQEEFAEHDQVQIEEPEMNVIEGPESDSEEEQPSHDWKTGYDLVLNKPASHLNSLPTSLSNHYNRGVAQYPHVEKRRTGSAYGEILDPGECQVFNLEEKKNESLVDDLQEALNYLDRESRGNLEHVDLPYKLESIEFDGPINCAIKCVEYEGLSDGRSVKVILETIRPRKLVLVHGKPSELTFLAESIRQTSDADSVVTVSNFPPERINISVLPDMYHIRLDEGLFSQLLFVQCGDYKVARISQATMEASREDSEAHQLPLLKRIKNHDWSNRQWEGLLKGTEHGWECDNFLVGEIRLSQFRVDLKDRGYAAKFDAGKLQIPQLGISLYKNLSGDLVFEGALSKEYYRIRTLAYERFVQL